MKTIKCILFFTIFTSLLYSQTIDTVKIEEVVITSTRNEGLLKNTAELIRVIPKREIEKLNATSVGEVLNYVSGVNIEGGTGSGLPKRSIVNMNGFPASYNLVLVDGARLLSDHIHTGQNIELIPVENIERIEIIRGSASSQYGSDAMGGIINIITKKCGENAGGNISTVAGTNETYGINFTVYAPVNEKIKTSAFVGWEKSKGIDIIAPANRVGNMGYTRKVIMTKYDNKISNKTDLFLNINAVEYRMEWTDGERYSHFYNPRLGLNNKLNNNSGLNTSFSFGHWKAQQNNELNELLQPGINYYIKTNEKNTLYLGCDLRHNTFQRNKVNKKSQLQYGLYIQDEYKLSNKLFFMSAIRADFPEQIDVVFSPKLSILYKPVIDRIFIRASAGRGFHAPTIQELYEEGFGHSGRALRFGNPNLKPEYSTTYTFSTEFFTNNGLGLFLNSYYNIIDNMIVPVYNGVWDIDPSKDVWMRENIHKALIYGAEISLKYSLLNGFMLDGSYSWSENKDVNSMRKLPYMPGKAITTKISYNTRLINNYYFNFYTGLRAVSDRMAWNWKPAIGAVDDNMEGLTRELNNYQKIDAGITISYLNKYKVYVKAYNILRQEIETLDDAYTVIEGKLLYSTGFVYNF